MSRASHGSTVTIRYIGTLDNGRIFDSSDGSGPLTVTIGSGQLFPALEEALIGMQAGEARNIVLTPEQAYGHRSEENILTIGRGMFPAERELTIGQKLSIQFRDGAARIMVITAVSETEVVLDGNHPLAGQELTFALHLERID